MEKQRKRKNYFTFLPDMITLFNLFSGFLAILMISVKKFDAAAVFILLSFVWDSLDGNISRLFKNPTDFGRELDSLADIVSFVVAPAFFVAWFLLYTLNPWLILALFIYLGAGAYRLARFNIRPPVKQYFEGLPTPAAGIFLTLSVLTCIKNYWIDSSIFNTFIVAFLLVVSFLMVSRVKYPKFSAINFSQWQPFFYAECLAFILLLIFVNFETALSAVFLLFISLAPIITLKSTLKNDTLEQIGTDSLK